MHFETLDTYSLVCCATLVVGCQSLSTNVNQAMASVGGSGIVEIELTTSEVWVQGYCWFAFHFFCSLIILNDSHILWLLLFGD